MCLSLILVKYSSQKKPWKQESALLKKSILVSNFEISKFSEDEITQYKDI